MINVDTKSYQPTQNRYIWIHYRAGHRALKTIPLSEFSDGTSMTASHVCSPSVIPYRTLWDYPSSTIFSAVPPRDWKYHICSLCSTLFVFNRNSIDGTALESIPGKYTFQSSDTAYNVNPNASEAQESSRVESRMYSTGLHVHLLGLRSDHDTSA